MHTKRRTIQVAILLAALSPLLIACSPAQGNADGGRAAGPASPSAQSSPAGAVCDKTQQGPATAPAGAVAVDPAVVGDLSKKTRSSPPGTTFWLAPGTHKLGGDRYDQVSPKEGNTYLGAPGAVLDGERTNQYAFTGTAGNVTIRSLTVQGFVPPHDEGVVNHDSADGWVIEHNTVQNNSGAALMAGARQQVRGNCLRANGQYGMNAFKSDNGITGLVVEGNEIVGNNTDDWEHRKPGCGCTGGIKFWAVNGADIRGNWVHDNRGPALWLDTNNNDFLIEGNLIEANDAAAIFVETSYNSVIRNNIIRKNNWVEGKDFAARGDNFPAATVYVSESGGEPRVKARTDKIEFYGNTMQNNWSGITLWENADRFCNSPANTSTDTCTLLVPDASKCSAPGIAKEPLRSDCRWKTKRVDIHDNRFELDPDAIEGCQMKCGRMAVLSNYGTYPDWSPYQGETVQEAVTYHQDNRWHDNTYAGPWAFTALDAGRILDVAQWQGDPTGQDRGSTFARKPGG